MNKEQLKEAVGELPCVDTVFNSCGSSYIDSAVPVMVVYDLIDQLDEPEVLPKELPVIPEYVADWITKHRKNLDLYPALKKLEGNPMTWKSIYEWYRINTHEFVNAYLTGEYEVEEEPKYYIIDKNDEVLWYRDNKGIPKLSGSTLRSVLKSNSKDRYQFTEQEIKGYDERYWPFAVPVEVAE